VKIAVYGEGHLADTHRQALEMHGRLANPDDDAPLELGIVAEDVTDHSDATQLGAVQEAFLQASWRCTYIIIASQVPPGWTREAAGPGLNRIFYQVDTIIVKRAVERVLRPEQIIVGCADSTAPLPLEYQAYLALHDCPVLQMSYESAELAKCMINVMLAQQVAVANDGAAVAKRIGASWEDVARALRNDARIGPAAYLRPGELNRHLQRDVSTIAQMVEESP